MRQAIGHEDDPHDCRAAAAAGRVRRSRPSTAAAGPPAAYRLGPGDQVRIITVSEDSLTGEFSVDDAGRIAVPMLGT